MTSSQGLVRLKAAGNLFRGPTKIDRGGPGYNGIMYSAPNPDLVTELRYALDVMEEYSHLGLDDESANRLRNILHRRIREAENALSPQPVATVRLPAKETKILA